ncbi:hypothetical protein [Streptomyces olivoreticuli]|uniref:hypothetical protein n=1 Tax=Streptomyces olivoreticuli TaxID=68246 RepID=UPI000E2828F1|nr:hypothetical protein [Streptomyces olivoreticuli]
MTDAQGKALGTLAVAVHVLDPVARIPLILTPGTEVTDLDIASQITNPACWHGNRVPVLGTERKTGRKSASTPDND